MKAFSVGLLSGLLFLTSCTKPTPSQRTAQIPEPSVPVVHAALEPTKPKAESIPFHSLRARTIERRGIKLTLVSFDRRNYRLVVADQSSGPGSRYDDAKDAGDGHLASINGGFFTPAGGPLGLVVTDGNHRGGVNRASFLGTGFFLGPKAKLLSRTDYLATSPSHEEVLQSGPRLVWSGDTPTGLSNKDERPRSFLLWDGKEHFALGYANSASLKGLSSLLQSQPISGFKIAYALNLDGGRSCDFWVSSSVNGGGFTRSSFFKKDVRNYLVLKRIP
jgi:hypothetical protein